MLRGQLEAAVQRALAESTAARAACAALAGRSLRIVVRHTPFELTLRSDGQTLQLGTGRAGGNIDATLSGSAPALLALAGAARHELVAGDTVMIDGDTAVAEAYARLLRLLRPDVETLLGRAMGRGPAHLLTAGARAALAQGRRQFGNLAASAVDYLAHERHELATRAEADQFQRELAELRARVARLDAALAADAPGGGDPR